MKKLIVAALLMSACSNGRNELMTGLVNEKKVLEDSIAIAHGYEVDFNTRAYQAKEDTVKSFALADSSGKMFGVGLRLKERLKAVEFSIDSLSKMK